MISFTQGGSPWVYRGHLGFPDGSDGKESPTMWVQFLGWEDPLEKGTVTHSSILVCRIPWTEEPGRLQSMGLQRIGHN